MNRDEMAGPIFTYSGALSACGSPLIFNESTILMIFSAIGGLCALGGLVYTIWNGNRNFRLAREQSELRRLEIDRLAQKV